MTFWIVRAGRHGEVENYAIENNVVAIGWHEVGDLTKPRNREQLQQLVTQTFPDETVGTIRIWTGELWAFKERIEIGDWVAIPLKSRAAIAVGRVKGPYKYVPDAPEDGRHQREVEWVRTDLARAELDQDLLYSLGSTLTIFRVKRNNAEERLAAIILGKPSKIGESTEREPSDQDDGAIDLEQFAADQIVNYIGRKFRGHELARLVGEILSAEGYKVQVSPPGADGGVDIIAGSGPMGFGQESGC